MEIVGQRKLINELKSYSTTNFPQSILLVGESGSGKNTIVSYISLLLGLDVIKLDKDCDKNSIYNDPLQHIYSIDLEDITEKDQNSLLKIVEEPPINCYLVLMCNHINLTLETIRNRCRIFFLEPYTIEELKTFTNRKDLDLSIFRTPGQLINFNFNTLEITSDLANKLVHKVDKANLPNTLTVADKFNYKDDYDKIDLNIFLNAFLNETKNEYLKVNDLKCFNYYKLAIDLKFRLVDKRFSKRNLVESFLIDLWGESRK